jgi:hypothetical protein
VIEVMAHDLPPAPEGEQPKPDEARQADAWKPKKKNKRPHWHRNRERKRQAA